jgi:hypothetical protein
VVQSVVGEITDGEIWDLLSGFSPHGSSSASNQAAAFPIYMLALLIGGVAGPFIGGTLSNPADKYGPFFQNSIFQRHPYFLPCLVAGTLALCGVLMVYLFLEEVSYFGHNYASNLNWRCLPPQTLPKEPLDGTGSNPVDDREPTLRELLSIPIIRALSISAFALNFNGTSFEVVFALFCYTPIANGGLGFSVGIVYLPFNLLWDS